jgi:NAD(P)H-hydrate epimerase
MKVVTTAEMQKIESVAQKDFYISSLILMENAGKEAAFFIGQKIFSGLTNKRVIIVVGKGNNAGDGFVLARHLINMGIHTRIFLLNKPEEFSPDALQNYRIISSMGVRIQVLSSEKDLQSLKIAFLYTDIVVDAVFGTGFKGIPPAFFAKVFDVINSSGISVVAIDIPSGIEADNGKVNGKAIRATWTLAMGLPKLGTMVDAGSTYAGEVIVIDISLPRALLSEKTLLHNIITKKFCKEINPDRIADSHKGNYGHLLAVGGSADMCGAAILTASAGMRSGCGLVTLALPKSIRALVAPQIPQSLTRSCPETDQGSFAKEASVELQQSVGGVQALVIGPGISRNLETMIFVRQLVAHSKIPVLLDADALYAFKDKLDLLKQRQGPVVITPHPGEMAMLTGQTIEEVQNARLETARKFASDYGVTVILKGYRTIISTKFGENYISVNGSSGMAKAGSGDVLAGLVGGLLAQGMKPSEAAVLGVYLHSRSGEMCAEKSSEQGMHAFDLVENLNHAWLELTK